MWGWYFSSYGISSKKIWDEPVHHIQLILCVWKLMTNPVLEHDFSKDSHSSLKGQLISKGLFGILNSSKKRTEKNSTTMIPQVELFLFVLWKNWRHQKKRHFEINWPLGLTLWPRIRSSIHTQKWLKLRLFCLLYSRKNSSSWSTKG